MAYEVRPFIPGWSLLLPSGAVPAQSAQRAFEIYAKSVSFDAVELRSWPCDTPRHFDAVEQCGQAVGGAVAVRQHVLQNIGGPCPALPDEAAMQDFSARLRVTGCKMGYCPSVKVEFSAQELPESSLAGYCRNVAGEYLMRKRWGNGAQRRAALRQYFDVVRAPRHFPGVRKALLRQLPGILWKGMFLQRQSGETLENVMENRCVRGRYHLRPLTAHPLVSVVVRTHARPHVLARTLQCLQWQTYENFEVLVVEDGLPTAEQIVKEGFPGMNLRYLSTGRHVGRGRAGNIGIENSHGEYVCFLDDDDYYYPDYLETSVCAMQQADVDMVLSSSMVFDIDVHSIAPFRFTIVKGPSPVVFDHINLLDMCVKCRIPLLSGMFRRTLYEKAGGGMREDLNGDEDWAMWLRFWRVAKRADDTKPDITRTLSLFGVPAGRQKAQQRLKEYEVYDRQMLADEGLHYTLSKQKFAQLHNQLFRDIAHLFTLGRLKEICDGARQQEVWYLPQNETWPLCITAKQLNGYYYGVMQCAAHQLEAGTLQQWLESSAM